MNDPIITVKNIGKRYSLRHQSGGYVALRDVIAGAFKRPLSLFKRGAGTTRETFWALKDINFEVGRGEVIGIVGRNGAGKSTLLKILSRITPPTTGEITLHGTVGSLLEVGTGFHPELTGRENIFLNGAILGMTKKEVSRKFDEIVAFAGIEKFLDTPVKHYSSGMYVRLAFSVAAHMEPDILIIDEVLAVGDAEFQKKCLGKMEEITKKDGRTILFVSHNMLAVQQLCTRCVLLVKGEVAMIGKTEDIVKRYLEGSESEGAAQTNIQLHGTNAGKIHFTDIAIATSEGKRSIKSHNALHISLGYGSDFRDSISDARVVVTITSERSKQVVLRLDSDVSGTSVRERLSPSGTLVCETGPINLSEGAYTADVDFLIQGTSCDYVRSAATFEVETDISKYGYAAYPDANVSDHVIAYDFKEA